MTEENKDIEIIYEDAFNNFEAKSDFDDWAAMEGKLSRQNYFSFGFYHFNIYYTSLIALVVFWGIFLGVKFSSSSAKVESKVQKENITTEQKNENIQSVPNTETRIIAQPEISPVASSPDENTQLNANKKSEIKTEEKQLQKFLNNINTNTQKKKEDQSMMFEFKETNSTSKTDQKINQETKNLIIPTEQNKPELPVTNTSPEDKANTQTITPVRKTIIIEKADTVFQYDTVKVKKKRKINKRH